MKRILAFSPHLDDAVFSAGGTLAGHASDGDAVTVVTCLTGNVDRPTGFALACQLDKGLSADIDYMALRRAEDIMACAAIDASVVHLPFLEAPHRGYDNPSALFAARRSDDTLAHDLIGTLRDLLALHRPDLVYGPYGVGNHVDHRIVRDALATVIGDTPLIWWEDFPYAMKESTSHSVIVRRSLDADAAQAKLAAVLCYESQLGFQFGSARHAADALSQWTCEGFVAAT